jgi:hypothetical protein
VNLDRVFRININSAAILIEEKCTTTVQKFILLTIHKPLIMKTRVIDLNHYTFKQLLIHKSPTVSPHATL